MLIPVLRRSLRVIVVEDDDRYREFLLETLRDMDCEAAPAVNAEDAGRLLGAWSPDAVVLDLNLPYVGGMEFLERLRARHAEVPVVIITGHGDLQCAQRAIRCGVTEFLTKPCHLGQIESAIDRVRRQIARLRASAESHGQGASAQPACPSNTRSLAEVERAAVLEALGDTRGNRSAAALRLGISRRALYDKLARYAREGFAIP